MDSFSVNWTAPFDKRGRGFALGRPSRERSVGRLAETEFHKVFLARLEGNTLVVTPRGDAIGFRDSDVASELKTLLGLAGSPGIVNLIVDLGSSNYFGVLMIGSIGQLGTRFQETGGRIALCEASPQMSETLHLMHVSDNWMTFDTRKIAVRAMRKV